MVEHLAPPGKPYITVQEAAKRWKTDVTHVLLWFRDGLIIPAYPFYDLLVDVWDDFSLEVEPDGNLSPNGNCVQEDVLFANTQLYVWSYTRQKKIKDDENRPCINLKDAWLTREPRGQKSAWYHPHSEKHDQLIPLESLVITQQEVDYLAKLAPKSAQEKTLSNKEKDNLLRAIGLLARVLAEKGGTKFGSPDKPNVNAIVDDLLMHLEHSNEDNKNGTLSTQGLSHSNLHNRITQGLKKLKF